MSTEGYEFPLPPEEMEKPKSPDYLLQRTIQFDSSLDPEKNRKSNIKILGIGEYLGRGGYSDWVMSVKVSILDKEEHLGPERDFAIKKYNFGESLKCALGTFEMLKANKVKTWTTFRMNQEESLAIMTHGSLGDKFLVTPNNEGGEEENNLQNIQIEEITNLPLLIEDLLTEVNKVSEKGIFVFFDAYSFFIERSVFDEQKSKIDFIISDLDDVFLDPETSKHSEIENSLIKLKERNLKELLKASKMFISKYVKKEKIDEYNYWIDERINDELKKL